MASIKRKGVASNRNGFRRESELHKLVLRAIKDDELPGLITDDAGLLAEKYLPREHQFPNLSIDHLCRMSAIRSGREVLKSLSLLRVLTSDKNISITDDETLRPDFVCINPERESIVLVELKKEVQSGRQALQELLAYEQELKNVLPFLSNYDCNFVLISPEWSTLMDHAVMAAVTWSKRKLLCLDAAKKDGRLSLRTRVPNAWAITGSAHFPEAALPCVTLCLYDMNASPDDELDSRLFTALDIIAREGDRLGTSGFALLWKDHSKVSLTEYNITVCGVSPFAFYRSSRYNGAIADTDGRLVKPLDKFMSEFDPAGHSESLMQVAKAADSLLKEVSTPTLEGFSDWGSDRITLCTRAEPILAESWGVMGDFMRDYVRHPAIRKHRRNTLGNGLWSWRDPRVALPLIQGFMRPELLSDGRVRCSDTFQFGVLLGLDRLLRANLKQPELSKNSNLKCRFRWNRMDLMTAVDEIRLLADGADNVEPPEKPLNFYEDPAVDDEADFQYFLEWLTMKFLNGSGIHMAFLMAGVNGALLFDMTDQWGLTKERKLKILKSIEREMRLCTGVVLTLFWQLKKEGGFYGELPSMYKTIRRVLGITAVSKQIINGIPLETLFLGWKNCLEAADRLVDAVFHRHSPVASIDVDWEWLQQGIHEARAKGDETIGVILLPNGTLVTGSVFPIDQANLRNFMVKPHADTEVYFLDSSSGLDVVTVRSWEELKSGEFIRKRPDGNGVTPDGVISP